MGKPGDEGDEGAVIPPLADQPLEIGDVIADAAPRRRGLREDLADYGRARGRRRRDPDLQPLDPLDDQASRSLPHGGSSSRWDPCGSTAALRRPHDRGGRGPDQGVDPTVTLVANSNPYSRGR